MFNKRFLSSFMAFLLVFTMSFNMAFMPKAFAEEMGAKKKAVIVLPGIAGSRLVAADDLNSADYLEGEFDKNNYYFYFEKGHLLWEPETSTMETKDLVGDLANNLPKLISELLMAAFDENGNTVAEVEADKLNVKEGYGAQNTYGDTMDALLPTCLALGYDLEFFSYDWRKSNVDVAAELESFINDKGYDEVILVGHSMGGIVASSYMARSEENKAKVDKLITLGTPYLGAPKALYMLETGNFFQDFTDILLSKSFKSIAKNFPSIYELLPTDKYFSLNNTSYVDKFEDNVGFENDKTRKLDFDEVYSLIESRDFARTSAGSVKPMIANAFAFQNSLFNGEHIASTVDSYIIVGYGKDTILGVEESFDGSGQYKGTKSLVIANSGDGTVPLASSTIGFTADEDRLYYVEETHVDLMNNEAVLDLVNKIIEGDAESYDKTIISKKLPESINLKGWIDTDDSERKVIKISDKLDVVAMDESSEVWAKYDDENGYNIAPENARFDVEEDSVSVYASDFDNVLEFRAKENGLITYTLSNFDAGYEKNRLVFANIDVEEGTLLRADLRENVLEIDGDLDGVVDRVILPTKVYTEEDLANNEDAPILTYYGLISTDRLLSTNLASKNLTITSNIASEGLISVVSSNFDNRGEFKAPTYFLNGEELELKPTDISTDFEDKLAKKLNLDNRDYVNVLNGTKIGNVVYVSKPHNTIDESIVAKEHLVFTSVDTKTKEPVLIYSKTGNITFTTTDIDLSGIIYAPNGNVTITGKNVNFNGLIIARKIYITGTNTEIKNNVDFAELK